MGILKFVTSVVLVASLSACGGGGGNAGSPSGSAGSSGGGTNTVAALYTSAPASITLQDGTTSSPYLIAGGTPPYRAEVDNQSIMSAAVSGSTLTISALAGKSGSGSAVVTDSVGVKVTVSVTVPSSAAVSTNAPANLQLSVGATNFIDVFGGIPFTSGNRYVVNNSNPLVVNTPPIGSLSNRLTVQALLPGTATIAISDSRGTVSTFTVVVPAANTLFTDAPASLTLANGTSNVYTVFGGIPLTGSKAYNVNIAFPSVASAVMSGSTLTVTALSAGTTNIVLSDSVGNTTTLVVTVPVAGSLFTTAGSAIQMSPANSASFTILGGAAPFTATSSVQSLVPTPVVSGSTFTISANANTAGGSSTVTVTDARGSFVTITVTVPAPANLFTTAPSALTMPATTAAAKTLSFAVAGGVPGYSIASSNEAAVAVSPKKLAVGENAFTLTTVGGGSSVITITDATGKTVSIAATVPVPAVLYTTAPANVTVGLGVANKRDFIISGGVSPYTVVSANETVASSGGGTTTGAFSVTGQNPGSTSFDIVDSAGTKITIAVTVVAPTTLYSDSQANITLGSGVTYVAKIYGGSPFTTGARYVANVSNAAVVTASAIAVDAQGVATLTMTAKALGSATVAVSDSRGSLLIFQVTVPATNVVYTDAPATLTVASATQSVFTIYGGTARAVSAPTDAKYFLSNSNPALVTATLQGSTLTVLGNKPGVATLTISDDLGASASVAVTVVNQGALLSSAPTTLNLIKGGANATPYGVFGGSPYTTGSKYRVSSSNPAAVSAVLDNASGTQLTIAGLQTGSANVVLTDSAGATFVIAVTVSPPSALTSTAPSSLALASDLVPRYFAIFGGTPPYAVISTNSGIATAAVGSLSSGGVFSVAASGTTLAITPVTPGATKIIVSDQAGVTTTIDLSIVGSGALITTAPSAVTVATTKAETYAISGGVPPYVVTTTNRTVVDAVASGAAGFTITGKLAGSANVVVTDAANSSVTVAVTVPAPGVLFTTAPNPVNITRGGGLYSYLISGGFPDPGYGYRARSSDESIVSASVSGNAAAGYTVNIASVASSAAINAGSATVVITDGQGQTKSIVVNVGFSTKIFTTAPTNGVTLSTSGGSSTYLINGGTVFEDGSVQLYKVTSSNEAVVKASVASSVLTVTPVGSGTATITLTDAIGTKHEISFTVVVPGGGGLSASQYPSLTPVLMTAPNTGTGIATSSIDATIPSVLKVTMKDPNGQLIPNQLVTVLGDPTKITFPDGTTALTDSFGVASFKISRASLLATGAGVITVTYNYLPGSIAAYPSGAALPSSPSTVTSYVGYQVTTANISLSSLKLGLATDADPVANPTPLAAYGTRQISVLANVTTSGVTSFATSPVTVTFTSNCGQVVPSTVTTDVTTGLASTTFSASDGAGTSPSTLGCSGKVVQINASTAGASTASGNLTVLAAPATSMSFVSASPSRIYLANSGGVTQSLLTFQLLNQAGEGISGQQVKLTLKTLTGGAPTAKASFDTAGATASVILTTDSSGKLSQPVYAGSVPANVIVNAALVATPSINIDSSVLTVASGRPAQSRLSLAIEKLAIEGYNVDGVTTNVTLYMSDRNGNPVPDGTAVNFVTEAGVMIPPSCTTGTDSSGNSFCTVKIRSQGTRPTATPVGLAPGDSRYKGRVTILAYAPGEMDFTDSGNGASGTAGNNLYDCGEPFVDLGNAYRSDSWDPAYSPTPPAYKAGDFTVPRAVNTGTACGSATVGDGVPSTFGGVWGAADVRKQAIIVFATSGALVTRDAISSSALSFTVADVNGNSMPTGTTVAVTTGDGTPNNGVACVVSTGAAQAVANTLNPTSFAATFNGCTTGDTYIVTVTSPLGTLTSTAFTIP